MQDKTGAETIEQLCSDLQLTEQQLARAFGITIAQLRVLKRADNISYTTLAGRRLKAALNISSQELRAGRMNVDKIKKTIEEALNKYVQIEDEKVVF